MDDVFTQRLAQAAALQKGLVFSSKKKKLKVWGIFLKSQIPVVP